jgi:hypothetical protein
MCSSRGVVRDLTRLCGVPLSDCNLNRPSTYDAVFIPFRPRLCENAKFENSSGKLPPIYNILRLENGFQWSVQVLTRPVMQRYPTCKKFKIVFTQPRPKPELTTLEAQQRTKDDKLAA